MKDFAVALTVGDETEDVRLLVDVVRRNWAGRFHIVVAALTERAAAAAGLCGVDEVVPVEGVGFGGGPRDALQRHLAGTLAEIDAIRKACGLAAAADAPCTIHLRAGSYALSWPQLRSFGEQMRQQGKAFAARGLGFGYYAHDTPVGSFDDSFFVFDNAVARTKRLWDFDLIDVLPHKIGVNGFLALRALGCLGAHQCWHYAGEVSAETRPPVLMDGARGFLRVDGSRLPGDLGTRLKAWGFATHGVTQGPAVEDLLAQSPATAGSPADEVVRVEGQLASFLRGKGLDLESFRGDLAAAERGKRQYDASASWGRAGWLASRRLEQAGARVSAAVRHRLMRGLVYRYRYGDMVWPRRLEAVYRDGLTGASHVPRDLQEPVVDLQRLA